MYTACLPIRIIWIQKKNLVHSYSRVSTFSLVFRTVNKHLSYLLSIWLSFGTLKYINWFAVFVLLVFFWTYYFFYSHVVRYTLYDVTYPWCFTEYKQIKIKIKMKILSKMACKSTHRKYQNGPKWGCWMNRDQSQTFSCASNNNKLKIVFH